MSNQHTQKYKIYENNEHYYSSIPNINNEHYYSSIPNINNKLFVTKQTMIIHSRANTTSEKWIQA